MNDEINKKSLTAGTGLFLSSPAITGTGLWAIFSRETPLTLLDYLTGVYGIAFIFGGLAAAIIAFAIIVDSLPEVEDE